MALKTILAGMTDKLPSLIFIGIRVVFIAIIFEFIAWWIGRRIENMTSPLMSADAGREHKWRTHRRTTLRQTPKLISRTLCYAVALLLVFDTFGVPVLPLSLAVGAVTLLFGAALLPSMRDAAQGYSLLSEDALAIGDAVDINGHQGIVEKFTLRGVWLRDSAGKAHCISNREITSIVVHARRTESVETSRALDPLAAVPVAAPARAPQKAKS